MSKKKNNVDSTPKDTRTRSWTFIVYPESVNPNWRNMLDDMHIEWLESPLHNLDFNANGEPKKEHIHVLLYFGGVKSYDQVKEITDKCNCPVPQKCHSMRAMVRYFLHLDNPDKAQYSAKDFKVYGGFDIDEYLMPSKSYRYCMVRDMIDFIRDNNITSYSNFIDICYEVDSNWWPIVCDNPRFIAMYIKARRDESFGY